MTQRDLFDATPSPPCQRHSDTSRAAAAAVEPRAATLRRAVLDYLRDRHPDGATDEEIAAALGMAGNTERPRRIELQAAGLVRDSGRTRATASGRKAVVWEVVP